MQSNTAKQPSQEVGLTKSDRAETLRYLDAAETPIWDALVKKSPQGSLFCSSWWPAANGRNTRILGYFEGERLIAGIPLIWETHSGVRVCGMPTYSGNWGVVIEPLSGKSVTRAAREIEILKIFARHLAREAVFFQSFHPTLQNWLPFYWNGFKQTTRFVYVLDELSDVNRVWDGFSRELQSEIRTASKLGLTVEPCDVSAVQHVELKSCARWRARRAGITQRLSTLYQVIRVRNAGECFSVKDRKGRVYAANLMVWDDRDAYLLAGAAADKEARNNGAAALLIWRLIQFCAERSLAFNFSRELDPLTDQFFRSFGGRQVAYSWIAKSPVWLRFGLKLSGRL